MFKSFSISGLGIVSPYGEGLGVFSEGVKNGSSGLASSTLFENPGSGELILGEAKNFNPKSFLKLDRVRGFDRLTLLVLEAVEDLYGRYGFFPDSEGRSLFAPEDVGACVGTAGSIHTISELDFQVVEDPQFVQPSLFPNCVTCAAIGYASIRYGIKAFNTTLSNGSTSSLDSFGFASLLLANQECKLALVGGAEELSVQYYILMREKYALRKMTFSPLAEGAAFFSCEKTQTLEASGRRSLAKVHSYATCFSPDAEKGLDFVLKKISGDAQSCGVGDLAAHYVSTPFALQEQEACLRIFSRQVPVVEISKTLGNLFSAAGSFQVAHALENPRIGPGSLVLITQTCVDGNISALLLEKC